MSSYMAKFLDTPGVSNEVAQIIKGAKEKAFFQNSNMKNGTNLQL